ncbi:hypothetical protein AK812_SmicGene31736 [Symbiodinium microadriaticum]|uniref:Uncharacterized protein n=1 Tax=Symbiodinium microadriaticum TaxID=2951 RepID=A0A1Q9CW11_SYMMI|nr:hypothetical protein AK812_SmicGene31736 [Symbiodinium microadriaticum]
MMQPDPAMSSERSSERYLVGDDVELPGDHVQSSDVNLLRKALLEAREFLLSGYTEVHFRVWRDVKPMKLLCARSARQHEGTMEIYLTYEDGGEEEGLLHPAGTGCTGPLFAFACKHQDGIPAPRRRLGRAHPIFLFENDLVEWTGAHGERERFSVTKVRGLNLKKTEVRGLSLKKTEVRGFNLKKTEAGTRNGRIGGAKGRKDGRTRLNGRMEDRIKQRTWERERVEHDRVDESVWTNGSD